MRLLERLRIVYRKLVFLRRDLRQPIPQLPPPFAELESIEADGAFAPTYTDYEDKVFTRADVENRLRMGERLFVARVTGQNAHFLWIQTAGFLMAAVGQRIEQIPGAARIRGVFTKLPYRNKGLAKFQYAEAMRTLAAESFRTAFLEVDDHNAASLRSVLGVGFEPYLTVRYLRLVLFRIIFFRGAKGWGLRVKINKAGGPALTRRLYADYAFGAGDPTQE